ncbi:hypothetical protein JCM24511_03737 [Saitozyma sp. JCM 24511]|nr:hypothetical protein JCM24511_03737 [Saitozyma sp. JCM 24511]
MLPSSVVWGQLQGDKSPQREDDKDPRQFLERQASLAMASKQSSKAPFSRATPFQARCRKFASTRYFASSFEGSWEQASAQERTMAGPKIPETGKEA